MKVLFDTQAHTGLYACKQEADVHQHKYFYLPFPFNLDVLLNEMLH